MMIRKPYITALLLLLSILMLAVPVVPHHHHGSEAICLKNDLHTGCGETNHHHHPVGHPNCCHDKGCLTHQFVQRRGWSARLPSRALSCNRPTSVCLSACCHPTPILIQPLYTHLTLNRCTASTSPVPRD